MVVVPSDYFVSTQLQLWLFCCWGCGCCWAVTTEVTTKRFAFAEEGCVVENVATEEVATVTENVNTEKVVRDVNIETVEETNKVTVEKNAVEVEIMLLQ